MELAGDDVSTEALLCAQLSTQLYLEGLYSPGLEHL